MAAVPGDQHAPLRKIRDHVEQVFDGRRSVPVALHEDDRYLTGHLGAEIVAHVGARPDVGGRQKAIEIPMPQEERGGVRPQQVFPPRRDAQARVDERANQGDLAFPVPPLAEHGPRPVVVRMPVVQRQQQ